MKWTLMLFALGLGACITEPFVHGPMVGHTTETTAIIWARVDRHRPVVVRYGEDPSLEVATDSVPAVPTIGRDYTLHIPLVHLTPDTTYSYTLVQDGSPLVGPPYPTFTTAPNAPTTFRMAFGSCIEFTDVPILAQVLAAKPSLFLMIGDFHYSDTDNLLVHRGAYRERHALEPVSQLVAQTPTLAIWDDHDFTGDDSDGTTPGRQVALQAFLEYWANPSAGTGGVPGVWFDTSFGGVDLFMLDVRYWRDPTTGEMLGHAQHEWLLDALAASSTPFKLVVSGSVFNDNGTPDSWVAFPEARARVLDGIVERGITGVVLLSGDRHHSEAWLLREEPYPLYELVASSFSTAAAPCEPARTEGRLACATDDNYFGLLEFSMDREDPEMRFEIRNTAGKPVYELSVRASELLP